MTDHDENQAITPDGVTAPDADPGDGFDFGSLMAQASNLQAQMLAAQQQLAETELEGVAGGGAVRVTVTGGFEFRAVSIDPSAVDPSDVEMLEDLVLAALTDAAARIADLQSDAVDPGDLGLGGLDLGGLGDLFGS